jgi:acetate kinase
MDAAAIEDLLYSRSGLWVCPASRATCALLASGDPLAQEAVDVFVIASAGSSTRSQRRWADSMPSCSRRGSATRRRSALGCRDAGWLAFVRAIAANIAGGPCISTAECRTSSWVIPTDENLMIARHTLAVVAAPRPRAA